MILSGHPREGGEIQYTQTLAVAEYWMPAFAGNDDGGCR